MRSITPIFPGGRAGGGLLLVRLSAVATYFATPLEYEPPSIWVGFVIAGAILIGLRTRTAALFGMLGLFVTLPFAAMPEVSAAHALMFAAIALAGPGGYSLDAAIFGRRTIALPSRKHGRI